MEFFSSSRKNYQMFILLLRPSKQRLNCGMQNIYTQYGISGRENLSYEIYLYMTPESLRSELASSELTSHPLNLHSQFSGRAQNSCEKYIVYKLIIYIRKYSIPKILSTKTLYIFLCQLVEMKTFRHNIHPT